MTAINQQSEVHMENHERVSKILYDAIDEVNKTLSPGNMLEKSPDTVLIGGRGKLDSLGFVNLCLSIEERIERDFKRSISMVDFLNTTDNGSGTIGDMTQYVLRLLGLETVAK
jgi:acyl carrier protein